MIRDRIAPALDARQEQDLLLDVGSQRPASRPGLGGDVAVSYHEGMSLLAIDKPETLHGEWSHPSMGSGWTEVKRSESWN